MHCPGTHTGHQEEGTQGDVILDRGGNVVYSRADFPGLPFVANEFDSGECSCSLPCALFSQYPRHNCVS